MSDVVSALPELKSIKKVTDKDANKIKNIDNKPVVICGWCGAKEVYIDNERTECPNCDEYLY